MLSKNIDLSKLEKDHPKISYAIDQGLVHSSHLRLSMNANRLPGSFKHNMPILRIPIIRAVQNNKVLGEMLSVVEVVMILRRGPPNINNVAPLELLRLRLRSDLSLKCTRNCLHWLQNRSSTASEITGDVANDMGPERPRTFIPSVGRVGVYRCSTERSTSGKRLIIGTPGLQRRMPDNRSPV